MPFVRIDLISGRSPLEIQNILDAAHNAIVLAFGVPARDRYQLMQEHDERNLIIEDTGLDIERTRKRVLVTITSRPRTVAQKTNFYAELCRQFEERCAIPSSDVVVVINVTSDADWSFGLGRAQFLTGEL